jgi:hypothetical protein
LLLQAALSDIQPVSGRHPPSSFGLGQSRNRSPVKASVNVSETQDVVPPLSMAVGELEGARRIVGTPRL